MTRDTATLDQRLTGRFSWRAGDQCPVARALEVVGTRSAMLIIREAYYGTRRFDDFVDRVGITEPATAARLRDLTRAGLLERRPYREPGQRTRSEYRLTDMGRDLAPAVLGLFQWGAQYLCEEGRPPVRLVHEDCGAPVRVAVTCDRDHPVPLAEVEVLPGEPSRID